MNVRDSIEKIQAAFATLTDESLAALESSLEEELQLVRTLIAVRKILSRKLDDGETTVDADRREKAADEAKPAKPPEVDEEKRVRLARLKSDLVEFFDKHGDSRREFVIESMKAKGHEDGRSVSAVLSMSYGFEKKPDGRWGKIVRRVHELDDEDKDELGMR